MDLSEVLQLVAALAKAVEAQQLEFHLVNPDGSVTRAERGSVHVVLGTPDVVKVELVGSLVPSDHYPVEVVL